MTEDIQLLTAEEMNERRDHRAGCLSGLICCGLAVYYYLQLVESLDSPVKKIGFLGCGLFTMILGYKLRNLVWNTVLLGIIVFIGWKVVDWVIE